jgi:DNA-binding CsgD family transcriptional regulator
MQAILTQTELVVLQWLAEGKRIPEIAIIRDRSEKTIETQMSDIRRKLDVSNSNHAVAEGFRKGLIR